MTALVKADEIYHDEHDCTVKISNDNTKHLKVVSVSLKVDLTSGRTLVECVKTVKEAFAEACND